MKTKRLIRKSLEKGIINKAQAAEMEALRNSGSKSIRIMCLDMAVLIMMMASLMIIWQITTSSHLISCAAIGVYLLFVRIGILKLPSTMLSLRILMNVASGLFVLELAALALPEFSQVDDMAHFFFSSGMFASALVSLRKPDDFLVKMFLVASLIMFVSSGLNIVNSIGGAANILLVSSCVTIIALGPRESDLKLASQLVGIVFWLLSFTVFMCTEIDSTIMKIINWSLVISAGYTLKLESFNIPDRVSNTLVAWGAIFLTGTLIMFAIDKIGVRLPFAAALILLSVIAMISARKYIPAK